MNKKIFIALALASIFITTQSASTVAVKCYSASGTVDANCLSCPSTAVATCTSCASGYLLVSGVCTACKDSGCAVCTSSTTAGTCTTAADGYYLPSNPGTPSKCFDTGCKTCTATTTGTCTAAIDGYFLAANPGTPAKCFDTGCKTCTAATTGTCTAALPNYFLAANPGTPAKCNDPSASTCSSAAVSTACTTGTKDSNNYCCGVSNCGTCSSNTNDACATCSNSYTLQTDLSCNCIANCLTCASATLCSACKSGYTATGTSPAITACVASTPVPSTASPNSGSFNVTPAAVYTSSDTTAPAFTAQSGMAVYGPGFDSTTAYVWLFVSPSTVTGTYVINRRTLNGTYGASYAKVNGTADAAISTAIVSGNVVDYAVGPGYLGIASYVQGTNWNAASGATASEITVTYIAGNGSSATAKALTGNTNTNVFFQVLDMWYLNGTFYVAYAMSTHTPGTATAADTFALNGIYIQGVVVSTGALLYNSTGGVKMLSLTQSNSGTIGTTCTVGTTCASQPSSQVYSFMVGRQNFTQNADTVWYLWYDSSTANANTIKLGSINVTTGAATSGTTLVTTAAATGSSTPTSPLITTYYSPLGFMSSDTTYGAYVGKTVASYDGTTTTYTYSVLAYINGSSTAAGNVTIATGYYPSKIQGFGTSDGYVLVESHTATTSPTSGQNVLIQVERFYTNGTAVGSAVSLGTFASSDLSDAIYQDTNGTIVVGYHLRDTLTSKTYSGYVGAYLSQSLAGASTLTSIIAFLSLLIVALFAF